MGGLRAAKSMGLCTANSWFSANMQCKFRGLCAVKLWLGGLRNHQIYALDITLEKTSMSRRKTKCISFFVWFKRI